MSRYQPPAHTGTLSLMMKLTSTALLLASTALSAQTAPTIRLINAPDASSKPVLGLVAAVRQLPDGKLLVNDIQNRQLLMLDASLTNVSVIADSTSGGANSYGIRPGGIIPYLNDSTLFVDPAGLSMFVIDPMGKIMRVASVPRSQDAGTLGSNLQGLPSLDAKGRIVYRAGLGRIAPMARAAGGAPMGLPDFPDSAALVRVDLATRKLDTATFFKIPKVKMNVTQTERGMSMTNEINPLPIVDEWAVLADGSIAIVRGQDYHVDFVNPDGSLTASPKVPFDWQRLTDDDKMAIIDSARTRMEKARAAAATAPAAGGGRAGAEGMIVMNFSTGGDGARTRSASGATQNIPPLAFVSINEMPDYRPAFTAGAARADADGNLWIRTTAVRAGSVGGGPVYDVINRKGEVVDRVQVPAGRQIVGFAKGGVVYMQARDDNAAWIERTHR
jgi:hypothetical protein